MSFATELNKSVSSFRVLVNIDSIDAAYAGRFSFHEFTPLNGTELYSGRLLSAPSIAINRDSNQFGILVFSSSGFTLINSDGFFDTILTTYNLIGAKITVKIGFNEIALADYATIYTGYLENITINEDTADVSIGDLRKRLETGNSYDASFIDSVQAIENTLLANYAITAGSLYFNVTAMTAAKALAYDVFRIAPENDTVQYAIEDYVKSSLGFFYITEDGKYSYKMIDNAATASTTISKYDIINKHSINYDSSKVLASVTTESPEYNIQDVTNTAGSIYNIGIMFDSIFYHYTTTNAHINPYIGATNTSIIRSLDDGYTWSAIVIDTGNTNEPYSFASYGVRIVAGCEGGATYHSADAGVTWEASTNIGTTTVSYIYGLKCIPSKNMALAGIWNDGVGASIYRSEPAMINYTRVATASTLTNFYTFEGNSDDSIILAGTGKAGYSSTAAIYKSVDKGSTWSVISTAVFDSKGLVLKIKHVQGTVFVASVVASSPANLSGIYYTYSSGDTWERVFELPKDDAGGDYITNFCLLNDGSIIALTNKTDGSIYISKNNDNGSVGKVWELYFAKTLLYPSDYFPIRYATYNTQNGVLISHYQNSTVKAKPDSDFTWSLDTSHKTSTMSIYGIDTLKQFNTVLANYADATSLSTKFINYYKDLHGEFSVQVPIKYYALQVGDNVNVEIWRETVSMLGTKKCEILGKSYDLVNALITFNLRII